MIFFKIHAGLKMFKKKTFFLSIFSILVILSIVPVENTRNSKLYEINRSREDFEAYPVGYNMVDADRWSGVRSAADQYFEMNSTRVGHYVESSITAGWDDLSYQFSDPSATNPTGSNVSFMYRPIAATPTYDLIALQKTGGTSMLYIAQIGANLCGANGMVPVVLLGVTWGNWYNVTILIVNTGHFDVDVDGTLYTNGGAHFDNAGGNWASGITNFGIVQSTADVPATWEFFIDDIRPSWYNSTRIPITITGNAEMVLFPNATGTGTIIDPYIIEDLVIDATDTYCGMYLRGITDYVEIVNCTVLNVRDLYALDAGIRIAYCEHVTVSNCTIQNANRATSIFESDTITVDDMQFDNATITTGVYVLNSTNVVIGNLNATYGGSMVSIDNSGTITVSGGFMNHTDGIYVQDSTAVTIVNASFTNCTDGIHVQASTGVVTASNATNGTRGFNIQSNDFNVTACIVYNTTAGIVVAGNSSFVSNNTVYSNQDGIYICPSWFTNVTYNNVFNNSQFAIYCDTVRECTISDNTVYNNTNSGMYLIHFRENVVSDNILYDENNSIVLGYSAIGFEPENNTFSGNYIHDSVIGILLDEMTEYTNITANSFTNITNAAIMVGDQNCDVVNYTRILYNIFNSDNLSVSVSDNSEYTFVTYNYFINETALCENWSVVIWEYNYYRDYFALFPFAITTSVIMDELEFPYIISATITEMHPMYLPAWYPRSDHVDFLFYSNVNGQGIVFTNLKVFINSVQIANPSQTISHVLFRLTVQDFKGRLLYDEILNINATGNNINIGLDISVQIFFHFYSSIDYFGLDFTLIKLYIDNNRITRFDPIMELRIINVTVKDYSNMTIYTQIINLSTTGVYLDIALPIAPIVIQNLNYQAVIFNITRNGISTGLVIGKGMSVIMRFALGNYTYRVLDLNGHKLVERNAMFVGMGIIELGPYGDVPNVPDHDPMQFLSDADLLAFPDKTGFGTEIDPYVIESWFICANLTSPYSYCIDIENTMAYVEFHGIYMQGSRNIGSISANIIVKNASNVKFINCTSCDTNDSLYNVYVYGNSNNITFTNCSIDSSGWSVNVVGINIEDTMNLLINSTVITNCHTAIGLSNITIPNITMNTIYDVWNGIKTVIVEHCDNLVITNNSISGLIVGSGNGVYIRNSVNATVEENVIKTFGQSGIFLYNSDNSTIENNTFIGNEIGISVFRNDGISVENNFLINNRVGITIFHFNNTIINNFITRNFTFTSSVGIQIQDLNFWAYTSYTLLHNNVSKVTWGIILAVSDNVVIEKNFITYCHIAIVINNDALDSLIQENKFAHNANLLANFTTTTFINNYYYEYFILYPLDVPITLSSIILPHEYQVNLNTIDGEPLYYAQWYYRERILNLYFYTFDRFGIDFYWLNVSIDGEQIASNTQTIEQLIFRLTIKDFAGEILYEQMHNYNRTKNINLYLPIAVIELKNNYNFETTLVIFKSNSNLTFSLPAQFGTDIRLALGTYIYKVYSVNGTLLIDTSIIFDLGNNTRYSISIGSAVIPFQFTWVDTLVSIAVVAGVMILVFYAWYFYMYTKFKNVFKQKKPQGQSH